MPTKARRAQRTKVGVMTQKLIAPENWMTGAPSGSGLRGIAASRFYGCKFEQYK
jgi:hypothetical protein